MRKMRCLESKSGRGVEKQQCILFKGSSKEVFLRIECRQPHLVYEEVNWVDKERKKVDWVGKNI